MPLLDFILLFAGMYLMKNYWSDNFSINYPDTFIRIMLPGYCAVWILTVFLSGGYDLPIKPSRIIRGIFSGTILILIFYALLPEELRFSRALILLGAFWASAAMITARLIINLFTGRFSLAEEARKKLVIVGQSDEGNRILSLLKLSETTHNFIGFVAPAENAHQIKEEEYSGYYIGNTSRLRELIEVYGIDEIIFCGKDVSSQEIISFMSLTTGLNVEYKIAPPESMFIIGSNSVEDPGELYIIDINSINNRINKRNKRFIDIAISMVLLLLSPLLLFLQKDKDFYSNVFRVLSGKISWVGYAGHPSMLPKIKSGVLNPLDRLNRAVSDDLTINRLNSLYARDYKIYIDLSIIRKGWRNLGRKAV
jgi:FlaA1/EpsC-like NDP-sugar epimerase